MFCGRRFKVSRTRICILVLETFNILPRNIRRISEYRETYLAFLNTTRPTWYFWIPWDLSCNIRYQGLPGISEYHETYLVFLNTTRPTWFFWIQGDQIFKDYLVFMNTARPVWYFLTPWDQISKDYLIFLNTMRSILSKFQGLCGISEYDETFILLLESFILVFKSFILFLQSFKRIYIPFLYT